MSGPRPPSTQSSPTDLFPTICWEYLKPWIIIILHVHKTTFFKAIWCPSDYFIAPLVGNYWFINGYITWINVTSRHLTLGKTLNSASGEGGGGSGLDKAWSVSVTKPLATETAVLAYSNRKRWISFNYYSIEITRIMSGSFNLPNIFWAPWIVTAIQ